MAQKLFFDLKSLYGSGSYYNPPQNLLRRKEDEFRKDHIYHHTRKPPVCKHGDEWEVFQAKPVTVKATPVKVWWFTQLLQFLPHYKFNQCVARYQGNYKVRKFSCWDQFLCMAFAQLTYRESLRDIETCLNSHRQKLYHIGFRGQVSRSTLADANYTKDFRIYQDFGHILINTASQLYQDEDLGLDLKQVVYALDSTTIDLCLSTFPWARFRKTKADKWFFRKKVENMGLSL